MRVIHFIVSYLLLVIILLYIIDC